MSSNPTTATAAFRISSQQERTWLERERGVQQFAQCVIRIEGPLDAGKLESALQQVVTKYEILRTVLKRQTGVKLPFQVIRDKTELQFKQIAENGAIEELLRRERESLPSVEHGPALRALLIDTGVGRFALALTLPAFCADSAALNNLCSEIATTYGEGQTESSDVMQYADLVEWQNELLASEETKPGRDFWRDYCRGINFASPEALTLPSEKKQEAPFGFAFVAVSSNLSEPIASLASRLKVSHLSILLAAWRVLLSRTTSSLEITIGGEFDGRRYEELATAMGPLARYLPLRTELPPDASFSTVLAQVEKEWAEARNWQESFVWSQVSETENPFLPFAFAHCDLGPKHAAGGAEFGLERVQVVSEGFKLRLVGVRRGTELELEFDYDSSRLERAVVERMAGWYQRLLAAALANPAEKIARLPLLSEAERQQLLVEWNRTAAEYPVSQCLQDLFEAQAARTPERVAVRCGEQALTYAELNARANQLAHYLRRLGVGPDKLAGLCLERSAETIVAVMAVLKAGGAYVPLNPDNPAARLRQQMEGAVAVITEKKLAAQVPEFPGTTLVLDGAEKPWTQEPVSNPSRQTTPENLVYVLYTSGSTGVPKGVAVRHRNLVNYADFIGKRLELEKYPQGLQFATVSTLGADLGNTCIYPSLISGGTLHVIGYETATDGVRFAEYAAKYGTDVLKIVPSHMAALLQSQADGEQAKKLLPRKYLIFGGETLTPKLVEKIESLHGSCELLNHYGPTETTVGSLTLKLNEYAAGQAQELASIPIGRPIQNTQVYVLDQNLEPVPVGVTGELYIAGAGVTAGYLNQPEKTAERFIANPFSTDGNAKMYRTGDLARYVEGGAIEFLGRGDDQVKVRGFRIELGEIEAALARHAGVKQALVLARDDEQGDKRLLGYVVTQGKELTGEELREYLKQEVPDYMVPQAIAILAKFPLTANGKIDRAALPEPQTALAQRVYVAPRNETEQKIAAIWAEVLRRDLPTISIDDNFFDLGGHSLMATQVVSRIRRTLSIELPLRTLFEHASVAALAAEADKIAGGGHGDVLSLVRVPRGAPLPLSFAQQRLWVLDRIEPNNPLYNIPRAVQLKGQLDISSLVRALNEIVRRHESQRTTFGTDENGEPVQLIAESLDLDVPIVDLASYPDREAAARDMATRESQIPFDLSVGPLLRAKILKLGADNHILLLTMHHVVSDAWSAAIFFQELAALYEAFKEGRPSPLPELSVQYADYAAWQRTYLQGKVLEEQLNYWREHLQGAPPLLELPSERPRPEARTFAGAYEAISLAPDMGSAIKEFSQKEGATPFMVLLAAFNVLLSRYSGQQHIVLGTDIANRTTSETERMIGFFINLLPLHTDLSGDPTFKQLVSRVREIALGAYAHQDIPFDKLVADLRPERSLSHNPIVQALFVMQNIPPQQRQLAGVELLYFPVPITRSKFDVGVFMRESNGATFQDWLYSTELFDRGTILRMAANFETVLRDALSHPEKRVSELQVQSEAEKQRIEAERNARKQTQRKKLGSAQPKAIQLGGKEHED
jgi:amino acid adenylation domain-containing protein